MEPAPASHSRKILRLVLFFAVQFSYLGTILLLSACYSHRAKLTGFDVLASPGEEIELKAKLEYDGPAFLNVDVSGVELEFLSSGGLSPPLFPDPVSLMPAGQKPLQTVTTGGGGFARHSMQAPSEPGNHLFWVRLKDPRRLDLGRPASLFMVSVMPKDQEILITDIDGTISETRVRPVLEDRPEEISPLPGAPEVLREAEKKYRIIYLSARSTYLEHRTRNWLYTHKFPTGPIILRDLWKEWRSLNFKEGNFKFQACELIKFDRGYKEIAWGIGNRDGDALGYAKNQIPAIIVNGDEEAIEKARQMYPRRIRTAKSWEEIREIILPR